MTDRAGDRIRAFAADAMSAARLPPAAAGLLAVGWATVDTDRAVAHLARVLGIDDSEFTAAPVSAALGAQCRIVSAAGLAAGDIMLAVIEPATEGRLAAALARWDEGPVVAWYDATATADDAGPGLPGLPGPFGRERIVPGDPLTGPHRLLVLSVAGTIAP